MSINQVLLWDEQACLGQQGKPKKLLPSTYMIYMIHTKETKQATYNNLAKANLRYSASHLSWVPKDAMESYGKGCEEKRSTKVVLNWRCKMKKCKDAKMQKLIKITILILCQSTHLLQIPGRGQHNKLWERAHPCNRRETYFSNADTKQGSHWNWRRLRTTKYSIFPKKITIFPAVLCGLEPV